MEVLRNDVFDKVINHSVGVSLQPLKVVTASFEFELVDDLLLTHKAQFGIQLQEDIQGLKHLLDESCILRVQPQNDALQDLILVVVEYVQVNLFIHSGDQQVGYYNGGLSSDVYINAFLQTEDLVDQATVVQKNSDLCV